MANPPVGLHALGSSGGMMAPPPIAPPLPIGAGPNISYNGPSPQQAFNAANAMGGGQKSGAAAGPVTPMVTPGPVPGYTPTPAAPTMPNAQNIGGMGIPYQTVGGQNMAGLNEGGRGDPIPWNYAVNGAPNYGTADNPSPIPLSGQNVTSGSWWPQSLGGGATPAAPATPTAPVGGTALSPGPSPYGKGGLNSPNFGGIPSISIPGATAVGTAMGPGPSPYGKNYQQMLAQGLQNAGSA